MANLGSDGKPILCNGFINLFKPPGITSMDALRHVKRITGQRKKVGHCGTMDPLARGVLPVAFGQATRLMENVVGGRKIYRVEITLGVETTTYDAEGEVVNTVDASNITRNMIDSSIRPWIGEVQQTPPMYSAIKVDGKRLYKLARAGVEIERKSRPVAIHDIQVIEFDSPKLVLVVECGKGTYIRSLAYDLGKSLGCGGHVADLVRLLCGGFHSEESVTLEQLEEAVDRPEGWQQYLFPVDRVLSKLKSISLAKTAEIHLMHGQSFSQDLPNLEEGESEAKDLEERRAYNSEGIFLAMVRFDKPTHTWHPVKVFQPSTPSPSASVSI